MEYDIVAGIPSYNNQNTIGFVAQQIDKSLTNHFSKFKSIIVNCDGRSHDNTTKVFLETDTKTEKKVLLAKPGTTGKGTVFKQLFEFAQRVKARAIVVNDSDLRSINPEWVRSQLTAILGQGYDFAAPYYIRHKYDASITNHICYPIVYALLGCDIRQPIGGDFAFSSRLCNHWLKQDWNKEAYLFGIDIFMTTTAILGGFKLCQVKLGAKIHDAKDPSQSLVPMFKQVVATLFRVVNLYLEELSKVKGVANPPILGNLNPSEPEPIQVDLESAKRRFVEGFNLQRETIRMCLPSEIYKLLLEPEPNLTAQEWAKILYSYIIAVRRFGSKVIESMIPLWLGRFYCYVKETEQMSTKEAETVVRNQAKVFEEMRDWFFKQLQSL